VSSPFDQLAGSYSALWSGTPEGRSQREEVWREVDRLFRPAERILDLGCGIGDDALHFIQNGIEVFCIDSSQDMVDVALSRGVEAHLLSANDLSILTEDFDGAISNFGALNCIPNLEPVARGLASVIPPGGLVALCVMGRFSWRESVRYLFRLNPRKATRRWWGRAVWRGIQIRYWSARDLRKAFSPQFVVEQRVAIGRGDHQLYVLRRSWEC
jgi:SAM-dependent methyltransferase